MLLRNDEGTEAEANSVIALLMLDSAKGRQIEIEATGPQEVEALAAVIALFNSGFDERLGHFAFVSSSPQKTPPGVFLFPRLFCLRRYCTFRALFRPD
ncbi:phosphohistidinoprotein-hexose phosphotransferase component of N-regulated PTS system (Npr) [Citrobacter koseri]|nr:phosphohistidinoprotein-hexose phosphotransferase component of N-regulated PTS system (Npr) [Citrobacter koseri]